MATCDPEEKTLASGVFTRRWHAVEPRAVVLLAHGLGEHTGRYQHLADALTVRGLSVWAPDHPGHGRSPGRRCHIRRFDDFYPALDTLRDEIDACHPGLSCFLVGHSMGGLIAGCYLLGRQERFAGAAFSGAAFEVPEPPAAVAIWINRLLAMLVPGLGVLQLDASAVSRDPDVVQRYREDPLVHSGKISARLVVELFSAMATLEAQRASLRLPALIMHGEADAMTPCAGSRRFYDAIGSADKTLRLYPGLFHEIFNEPEQVQVLGELGDWLDAHLETA